MAAEDSGGSHIELGEEIEGELAGTRNYRFSRIGEAVPILDTEEFDPQCLPSQPLAVSERLRLLFVAHPNGFCVTRTKDVVESAVEVKEKGRGPSVGELSLVDVRIGKVSMLVLSGDDSTLAAVVESHIHFFAVSALLHKEQKPSYSVSLDDSSSIKDMRWAKKDAKAYLILSASGKLCHGSGQASPTCIMEDVDSVDWSVGGNFVVMAKNNTLSILSLEFKKKMSFSLPFCSVAGDSDVNKAIKVDSVRWVRPDCIAVGYFELNEDGGEENYTVQLVTSRGQRIMDAASKPIVLSFDSIFLDFDPDAVPARNGPHLLLSYLDPFGVAFTANRNLSRSVGLFSWAMGNEGNEASVVEILDDAWSFHMDDFQDNGEDNVLLGLCVDKAAQNENIKLTLGDQEVEVSPCCVILCVTIDGKISAFHFFSAIGASSSPEYAVSDEEDSGSHLPITTGETSKQTALKPESHESTKPEFGKADAKATSTFDRPPSSFHVNLQPEEQTASKSTGHKPFENFRKQEVDEPEKFLPILPTPDKKAEKQPTSEVKSSLSSVKEIGDLSSQSMGNSPLLGRTVEPLGKVPAKDLQGGLSSTWSNDALKTSAGRFLSPNPVGTSDKPAFQSAGRILRDPTGVKDNINTPVAFPSVGQAASAVQGNRQSVPSYPAQARLDESGPSLKSVTSAFKKESAATSSPVPFSTSAQNAPKQFGNVEEMAKKLDKLLEGIQGHGGFVDACITAQENAVVGLEDAMQALSNRCRMWRGLLDDRSREVQFLLDKTVQVLVRKEYMEGIFKQATDSRYWELWNRQKLSSELDLKRRCILDINQELTNQLIDLERHFNALELNKFGDSGGIQRNRSATRSWSGHSREIKPLHSLYNTMTAQLAVAEQLSGCLSEQMSALSIETSAKHDAKRKLFESIGLSYAGDSHRSPGRDSTFSTPKKELLTATSSAATKEQSRRNSTSTTKKFEAETARRHRDSLDRSWATFEPPKTTVSRMRVKDVEKASSSRSNIIPQLQKSETAQAGTWNSPRPSLNHNKSIGTTESAAKQSNDSASSYLLQRRVELLDNGVQGSSTLGFPKLSPPSMSKSNVAQIGELGAFRPTDEKSKGTVLFGGNTDSFGGSKEKFSEHSARTFSPAQSTSTWVPEQSLKQSSNNTENSSNPKVGFLATGSQKSTQVLSEGGNISSDVRIPVTSSAFSSALNASVRARDAGAASTPLQSAFGSPSKTSNTGPAFASSLSKPSSQILFPVPPTSDATVAAKQDTKQSQDLAPTPSFPSGLSLATQRNLSPVSSSSTIAKPESLTPVSESIAMHGSKTDQNSQLPTPVANMPSTKERDLKTAVSASQPVSAISTLDLNLGPSESPAPVEKSINPKSGPQVDLVTSSNPTSNFTPVMKSEQPAPTEAPSPLAQSMFSNHGNLKSVVSDDSPEEEMEEEAPETNQTTQFTLGNFSGFGLGSTPNSATATSNPFGVASVNKDTNSPASPFTMSSPTGGLFRPASFTFPSAQPLQSTTAAPFASGFGAGQVSGGGGFGQPATMGVGQQALGSVLGTFGQSRQVGAGIPGSNAATPTGFGGGFAGVSAGGFGGGFSSAATGGGFASLASAGGGFAAVGGGFAAAATSGGGFSAAAGSGAPVSGGGFGAFNQQGAGGGGGFSAFGGGSGASRPPSELFTQMRR